MDDLFLVGLRHGAGPIELLERLSYRPDEVPAALGRLRRI
jgi:hypothetical protein